MTHLHFMSLSDMLRVKIYELLYLDLFYQIKFSMKSGVMVRVIVIQSDSVQPVCSRQCTACSIFRFRAMGNFHVGGECMDTM